MLSPGEQILFTRQRHEAKRAGLHYDYRLVAGDKAYSWATKKEMPDPGSAIILFEQPVHTSHYALSERVDIPDGQYGAGTTTLDLVHKAHIGEHSTPEQLTIHTPSAKFLLKKLDPVKYGDKAWLFKNLTSAPSLEKSAKDLNPHQESALAQLEREKGVVLHHSTGSGKSLTFLTAVERQQQSDPNGRAFIVAPASLVSNVPKEIAKHGLKIDPSLLDVYSYEAAANRGQLLSKNKYALAIADEAHKLRNADTKRAKALYDIISGADKRILATATGTYNHLADISPLVNIASGLDKDVLPLERKAMENRYVQKIVNRPGFFKRLMGHPDTETINLRNGPELQSILNRYVNFYESKDDPALLSKFPSKTEETIEVPMSEEQEKYYKFVEGDLPFVLRMKVRNNIMLDKRDKATLNSFSTGVRQVSNSYSHLVNHDVNFTPKIEAAAKNLKARLDADPKFRGLVYSNYLGSGVTEYSKKLAQMGIDHQVYTGGLTRSEKDEMVRKYNHGESPVLVISSSGAEGLDLKGTSLVQVLEPHFNPSKIAQVVGRAARYESHEHLPQEARRVKVEHYLSVFPKPRFGKTPHSIDKYLFENSDDKDALFEQVKDLMRNNPNRDNRKN